MLGTTNLCWRLTALILLRTGSDPWESQSIVLGGGFYGTTTYPDPDNTGNKKSSGTTIVFAELAGPFVELEFASLTNLTAGFGHNSHMTLPTVDNVTSFPFLKSVTGSDPLQVLNGFIAPSGNAKAWFGHDENALGEIWMAAGFTATAFHALKVSTVMTVDFSSSDIIFGVFGNATASIPPDVPQTEQFAFADIGLLAVLDWNNGIFKVEGQLAPSSFILCHKCKLQGGFALCYFLEGSGHDGDWVFTVGGYHPSYVPPAWYPNPPRVGISWILDGNISISGNAYFAVIPQSGMGGGKLDLTFKSGHLKAWFDAYADFLVNYKPFSFQVDFGVSTGISYYVHIGFISHTFGVNFGCSLHIHGPPVAGYVHVDWSIISFDIHFGNANESTQQLDWYKFQDLLRQDGQVASASSAPLLVKASGSNGLMSNPDTDASTQISTLDDTKGSVSPSTWYVNHATFVFDITSMFPCTTISLNGLPLDERNGFGGTARAPFGNIHSTGDVAMKAMHVRTKVNASKINIKITDVHGDGKNFVPRPIIKQMSTAVWDTSNSTKPLLVGVRLSVPPPIESGPFIALDLSTSLSYDCYRDDAGHKPAALPSGTGISVTPTAGTVGDPFAAPTATFTNASEQAQAFDRAREAWKVSDNDALGEVLVALVEELGVRKGRGKEVRMKKFFGSYRPPGRLLADLETAFVAPPLMSVGVT